VAIPGASFILIHVKAKPENAKGKCSVFAWSSFKPADQWRSSSEGAMPDGVVQLIQGVWRARNQGPERLISGLLISAARSIESREEDDGAPSAGVERPNRHRRDCAAQRLQPDATVHAAGDKAFELVDEDFAHSLSFSPRSLSRCVLAHASIEKYGLSLFWRDA